ncbi:sensor histidine kinase [Pseudoroseicyclus tamaricis]|uniref:histidine kinase n=1 Tax=Pseudoroseicyclus tamaricis TaxID=2705421 RepID=A0A6B2JTN3_9RHOB|nr:ATP-binding protein [Pseudoroseicyclus tamaricis]NDV01638.1 PAS domain-containing protein [Pseudoroseicyclus tamaricis]
MDRAFAAALLDALPMPALLIGPAERVLAANGAAGRLFGWDGAGRHYITALRQPVLLDAVEQVFRDGEARQSRYLAQHGSRDATWRVQVAAVETQEGRGVLLSFEDITAVEEAGQIRRDFVANVSHELRTPLTALLGFVETLRGPAKDDPAARERFLSIMAREAGRMAQLVADLLSLSRVEEEERVRPMQPVDLKALAESVAAAFEPQASAAGVPLRLSLAEGAPSVPGDADQLRQVLNNLVENALKYGGARGVVEIGLTGPAPEPSLRSEGLRLFVRDEGEGIAAHHIPRLTERFYRVDSHRSREVGGTGLGLAIVKHIVNRHRGRLRVQSEEGVGTTFTLILPVG